MRNSAKSPLSNAPLAEATEAPQIVSGKKRPWHRLKGETALAYSYAWNYITMGPGRSIRKVSKKARVSRHMKRWSKKWKWVQRAAAYDLWMESKNRERAELFAEQEAKERQQRARDLREKMFQQGQQFIDAAALMVNAPIMEQQRVVERYEDGREKTVQIIKPARWRKLDALRFAQLGDAMAAAAIRNDGAMTTDRKWNNKTSKGILAAIGAAMNGRW